MAGAAVLGYHDAGYRIYVVRTGSMLPNYRPGDAVVDRPPTGSYRVGEVISFRSASGQEAIVTHRIHDIAGDVIHTKGDANRTPDIWNIAAQDVTGEVLRTLPYAGYAFVYLRNPAGIASVLCFVLVLAQAWRLYFPAAEA